MAYKRRVIVRKRRRGGALTRGAYPKHPISPQSALFWRRTERMSKGGILFSRSPFKPYMLTKNTYTETVGLTSGTAGIMGTEQVYRLNDMYDPNLTGTGHQPYGRDTLAGIYRNYKVYGCLVKVMFVDPSAESVACGVLFQNSSETATLTSLTVDAAKEKQDAVVKFVNNTGKQIVMVKKYIPISKIEGLSRTQFNGDFTKYSASIGASPTLTPYVRIAIGSLLGADNATIRAVCTLKYYVKWFNRIELAQS